MANLFNVKESKMTFWAHLGAFLHHLRRMLVSIIIATVIVMIFPISLNLNTLFSANPYFETITTFLVRKIQADFLPANVKLMPVSWFGPIEVYFFVSLMLGIIISSPVIAYELHKFINPALFSHERKTLSQFVASFTGLFILGFFIGYILVTPMTIRTLLFFNQLLGLVPNYEVSSFFFLIASCLLVSGLLFTFPTYVVLLVRANVLRTEQVAKNRKYLYPAIIALIAILDPDPTLITELFVGVPSIILFEISLRIARRYEK